LRVLLQAGLVSDISSSQFWTPGGLQTQDILANLWMKGERSGWEAGPLARGAALFDARAPTHFIPGSVAGSATAAIGSSGYGCAVEVAGAGSGELAAAPGAAPISMDPSNLFDFRTPCPQS
jgi:hypothetical protein